MDRLRIVVLDDNEVFAALLAAALEDDFDISIGHSGLQGLSLCLEAPPSAVVSDIGMPDLDGIQLLAEMARQPRLASIPVVIVTASHFNTRSRNELSRFTQVKRVLSKTQSMETIAAEVRAVVTKAHGV
jgi:CheY-like chemotaxis protein